MPLLNPVGINVLPPINIVLAAVPPTAVPPYCAFTPAVCESFQPVPITILSVLVLLIKLLSLPNIKLFSTPVPSNLLSLPIR